MHYFILTQINQLVYIHHTPEICYYFVTSHVTTTPYTLKLNLKLVHKPSNVENTLLILTCRVCDQLTLWRITTLLTTPYMFKRKRSKHTQRAYESVSIHTPCSWDLLLLYLQPHICLKRDIIHHPLWFKNFHKSRLVRTSNNIPSMFYI